MNWIEVLQAFVLGVIQGVTEFLPISSTGHLFLGRKLFGLQEMGLFLDTMLHIGTLVAVVIVYWRELVAIVRRPFSHLSLIVVIGTIPTLIIALLLDNLIEDLSKSGATIGYEFLVTGLLLWFADSWKKRGHKNLESIRYLDAFIIGIFQGLAVFPAISRSGSTIAAALFRKIDKEAAATYSFLLSIPSIAAAIAFQTLNMVRGTEHVQMVSVPALIVGILASGIFGYVAVRWMITLIKKSSLKWFAIYVWVLGAGIIIAQLAHVF